MQELATLPRIDKESYYNSLTAADRENLTRVIESLAKISQDVIGGKPAEVRAVGGTVRPKTFDTRRKDIDLRLVIENFSPELMDLILSRLASDLKNWQIMPYGSSGTQGYYGGSPYKMPGYPEHTYKIKLPTPKSPDIPNRTYTSHEYKFVVSLHPVDGVPIDLFFEGDLTTPHVVLYSQK